MSEKTGVAVLGGPSSGKTTYMGAVVRALKGNKIAHLELGDLPEHAIAYDRLTSPLAKLEFPKRTNDEQYALELPLRAKRGETIEDVSLLMGDYAGELVEKLFRDRNQGYSEEWRARAQAAGMLLFVRPEALTPLPRLRVADMSDRDRMLALKATAEAPKKVRQKDRPHEDPESAFGPGLQDEPEQPIIAAPTDRVKEPTVLAMVELLQFLRHERGLGPGERPKSGTLRIALLASAWDAADIAWQRKGPAAFFAENAPLLREFLWSNHRRDDIMYFGLSSTAGDLNDAEYKKKYRRERSGYVEWSDATGRIHRTKNVTLPIEWALFGDEAFTRIADDEIVHS